MANTTLQFAWIVGIKKTLAALFADDPMVFVAGDLLWYPLPGRDGQPAAPEADTMVVWGRPKGERGLYQQRGRAERRAERERQHREPAERRAEQMEARLREMGLAPQSLLNG